MAITLFFVLLSERSFSQVLNAESFDNATFPPTGWTQIATSASAVWARSTSGTNPTQSPHSGAGEAYFNSYNASTGVNSLITPPFTLQNNTSGAAVSFWMYRDAAYSTSGYAAEGVSVYYNTTLSTTGATLLGYIPRSSAFTPTVAVDGWYQYGFTIPNTVTNSAVYLILSANSLYGNNIYMDDINWTSYPPLCSGTPVVPTVAISSTVGCPSVGFNLSASGTATGAGVTFQWQSSTSSGGTYANIGGGTTSSYGTSTGSTTYYRLVTTCASSGLTSTSSVVSYSVNNPGPCICNSYPVSYATSTSDEDILQVKIGSVLNNASACTTTASGSGSLNKQYSNYAGVVSAPLLCKGATYASTVNVGTCNSWYSIGISIFIDYNQNGVFTDAGEQVYLVPYTSGIQGDNVGSFTIPTTALSGTTRMRVVATEGSSNPVSNATYGYGETEDYCVNIQAQPTVTVSATSGSICPGGAFTVSATGASTYSWVSSTSTVTGASATLSPIVNTTYTATGTGTTGCAASGTNAPTLTVTTLTSPSLVVVATPTGVCPGFSSNVTVTGANTYTWTSPASNATAIAVTPGATTVYTVTGTGTTVCNGVKTVTVTIYPQPTITVNSNTLCAGQVFTMVPGGASTYTFSNGSNTVAPTTTTFYTVSGTNSLGCISATTAVSNVTVLALPVVTAPSGTICNGSQFVFTPGGATSYTFVNASNPVSPTVTTTYSIIGSTTIGCTSLPALVTVTVFNLPTLAVASTPTDMVICQTSPINFTVSGANTYTWNNVTPGAIFTDAPPTSTNYFVVATDANGCTNFASYQVTVNPLPSLTLVSTSTFVCASGSSTLTASGANTYSWTTNSASTSIVVTPNITSVFGVTGTSTLGCAKTLTTTINVNAITLTLSANTAVCAGSGANLTANAGTNATYLWSNNAVFGATSVTPAITTTYTVNATDNKSCHHTGAVTVTVNSLPTIVASSSRTLICKGEPQMLHATGAATLSWGSAGTGDSVLVTGQSPGTFMYIVTGTDTEGCMSSDTISIKVDKCTGINELASGINGLHVYPNPNTGVFTIELNNNLNKNIQVIDLTGRTILSRESSDDKTLVNLNGFASGIYYVKVQSDKHVEVIKVIKQ